MENTQNSTINPTNENQIDDLNTMSTRSRLRSRLEKQSKRNLFLSIAGMLIIGFLLLQYGIPLLVNTSLFLIGSNNSIEEKKETKKGFISPPVLEPIFTATNSAVVTIKGSAFKDQEIALYINDDLTDKIKTEDDGSFEFKDIRLKKGDNQIQTKAIVGEDESNFSNTLSISYKDSAPSLSIDSPPDGQSFSKDDKTVEVKGKTDSGLKVTVNDFWAIVEGDGSFSYTITLKEGENQIKVVATDEAGNSTTQERKVTYSP